MRFLPFLIILLFFVACRKQEIILEPRGALLETENVKEISKSECISLVDSADISPFAKYGVRLIKIIYSTAGENGNIKASGMLFLPIGVDTLRQITHCHGTIVPIPLFGKDKQTPSLFSGQNKDYIEARNVGVAWASAGYTVFMPDYVGYGVSGKEEHPYVFYPELAKGIYDGNKAVRTYLKEKKTHLKSGLILTGYSQGAGASLYTHKLYETKYTGELSIKASFNLSGPYNFRRFITTIYAQKDQKVKNLRVYAWALYSMNKFSSLKRPNDLIFSYPVYDQVAALTPPSSIPNDIFNIYAVEKIVNGEDTQANAVIKENMAYVDWSMQSKVYLYHGNNDDLVPYYNSQDCYQELISKGGNVQFKTYEGRTHYNVLGLFVLDALKEIKTFY